MMTVPCECSGLWDCTGLGRTYFLESGWFLRTAATSAAPRPEPSVESIRSNWYSTPISWEMRDLGRHTWQHADKHCKLASRKNGTGTIPLGWCSSCKTIRGQQWDLHRDSAALLLGSNSAEGVTSSAHSAHVHHDTRPREKLSNSILSTSYKIASSWVLVLILCSIGRRV